MTDRILVAAATILFIVGLMMFARGIWLMVTP
jgi:hypothetical protein